MADFSNVPNFHLKIVFAAHFMLTSLSCIGFWAPASYLFYNFVLIITLLWSIHRHESDEPVQMCVFINGMSVMLDILVLAMCFPDSHAGRERFSAAIAIIHVILRPFSTLLLAKLLQGRSEMTEGGGIGNLFSGPRNRTYEDMDKNAGPPVPTGNQGGYDFTTAEQI